MGSDAGNLHQIERKQRITWALKWWDAWWDLLGLWHAMNSHILGFIPAEFIQFSYMDIHS